jgi:hypothetical protein
MTDSNGTASWTAVVAEAMRNAPLYLGTILVIVGGSGRIPYFNVELLSGMEYFFVGLGTLLLGLGAFFAIRDVRLRGVSIAKQLDTERYGVQIDSPYSGQTIDHVPFTITGRYDIRPPDAHRLWLITKRDGVYSPHRPLDKVTGSDHRWAVTYSTFRRNSWVTVGVYLVGESGQALIATYFRCCETIKKVKPDEPWPGIAALGADIVLCDERDMLVK